MKNVLFILISLFIFTSCGKDEPWSPVDDVNEFVTNNPYGIIFENTTAGDLYLKCEGLASSTFPILKQGADSEIFRGSQANISVEYTGEGTHFTPIKRQITLSKEKITRVSLSYP